MSSALDAAGELVVCFWREQAERTYTYENIARLYEVQTAKPEELAKDYEAIIKILKQALKEIEEANNNLGKERR